MAVLIKSQTSRTQRALFTDLLPNVLCDIYSNWYRFNISDEPVDAELSWDYVFLGFSSSAEERK